MKLKLQPSQTELLSRSVADSFLAMRAGGGNGSYGKMGEMGEMGVMGKWERWEVLKQKRCIWVDAPFCCLLKAGLLQLGVAILSHVAELFLDADELVVLSHTVST